MSLVFRFVKVILMILVAGPNAAGLKSANFLSSQLPCWHEVTVTRTTVSHWKTDKSEYSAKSFSFSFIPHQQIPNVSMLSILQDEEARQELH